MRRDAWWVQPIAVFIGLGGFVLYTTWAALQGDNYTYGPYLSPLYSPELFGEIRPSFWPGEFMGLMVPWSPAQTPRPSAPWSWLTLFQA